MFVELEIEERELMVRLVERRLAELARELARRKVPHGDEPAKHEHDALEHLLHRLHESEWDVTA